MGDGLRCGTHHSLDRLDRLGSSMRRLSKSSFSVPDCAISIVVSDRSTSIDAKDDLGPSCQGRRLTLIGPLTEHTMSVMHVPGVWSLPSLLGGRRGESTFKRRLALRVIALRHHGSESRRSPAKRSLSGDTTESKPIRASLADDSKRLPAVEPLPVHCRAMQARSGFSLLRLVYLL